MTKLNVLYLTCYTGDGCSCCCSSWGWFMNSYIHWDLKLSIGAKIPAAALCRQVTHCHTENLWDTWIDGHFFSTNWSSPTHAVGVTQPAPPCYLFMFIVTNDSHTSSFKCLNFLLVHVQNWLILGKKAPYKLSMVRLYYLRHLREYLTRISNVLKTFIGFYLWWLTAENLVWYLSFHFPQHSASNHRSSASHH